MSQVSHAYHYFSLNPIRFVGGGTDYEDDTKRCKHNRLRSAIPTETLQLSTLVGYKEYGGGQGWTQIVNFSEDTILV